MLRLFMHIECPPTGSLFDMGRRPSSINLKFRSFSRSFVLFVVQPRAFAYVPGLNFSLPRNDFDPLPGHIQVRSETTDDRSCPLYDLPDSAGLSAL